MPSTLKTKAAVTFSAPRELDPAKLTHLFNQASWAKGRTEADAKQMLANTDLSVCVWDGERLVGFGRVLTDYVYRASIWDIIVDKTYQGQGIGAELVRRILNHPRLKKVQLFWLCTRTPRFYEKLGFSSKEQTGMVWSRSKHTRVD